MSFSRKLAWCARDFCYGWLPFLALCWLLEYLTLCGLYTCARR